MSCRCQRRQRIGGDDGGDLVQPPTPQPVRPNGEPSPVVIGQAQAPSVELPSQEAVLLDHVGQRLPLSAIEPAGDDHQ
jgi:hypothetical protein